MDGFATTRSISWNLPDATNDNMMKLANQTDMLKSDPFIILLGTCKTEW
jgi:hypothetical protein